MYKVKLTFPYPEWDLKRQTPNSSATWGNYKFFINQEIEECDYWFVFNYLLQEEEMVKCNKKNVILITGEAFEALQYNQAFTDQFGGIITCQEEIKHPNKTYYLQGHPYFVGTYYKNGKYSHFTKGYDELMDKFYVPKNKNISIITSDKLFLDGHKKRYEFCMALKDYFGNEIDLYGRGVNDFEDKWDVLADYKYSIAIENLVCKDWITEKISDCFLAHTFPLYYGSPNVNQYFNDKSFHTIDIENLNSSKKNIEAILNNKSHYEERLPFIIESKINYLNNYNIFPLIANYIEKNLNNDLVGNKIILNNNFLYKEKQNFNLGQKLKNSINEIIAKIK